MSGKNTSRKPVDRPKHFLRWSMRKIGGICVAIGVALLVTFVIVPAIRACLEDDLPEVEIVAVQFDAPSGNDWEYLNEEWVELKNKDSSAIDMSGWILYDENKHTYTFPEGFTLPVSGFVTVYTGSEEDTESNLYWSSKTPIWNNDGDTATLEDSKGRCIYEWCSR